MPLPRLLHPIKITVQILDKGGTFYDEDTREPVQKASHFADQIIPGQVFWGKADELHATAGGVQEDSAGYVLFRYVDLKALGVELKLNDRFTQMGHLETDVYIVKLQPMGHYPDQDGPALLRAYFADRQPGRQGEGR